MNLISLSEVFQRLFIFKSRPLGLSMLILLVISGQLSAQNVGVGTNSPQEKLHVAGDVRTDGALIINPTSKSAAASISIASDNGMVLITNSSGSQANAISMSGTPSGGQVLVIVNADDDNATFASTTIAPSKMLQFIYSGSAWIAQSTAGTSNTTSIADADNDTKIQVESTSDEDIIHLDIAGVEVWQFDEHRFEPNFRGNILIGWQTGLGLESSTGSLNTLIGEEAGYDLTTGSSNSALGGYAGNNLTTGSYNVLVGRNAGNGLTTGQGNSFVGYRAGYSITTQSDNTFFGENAAYSLTGTDNVFMGKASGFFMDGDDNVVIGSGAALNANYTSGDADKNVIIGKDAARNALSLGDANILIGYQAAYAENISNKLYIENSSSTSPLIYGEFDNDLLRINGELNINNEFSFPTTDGSANQVLETDGSGSLSWTTISSGSGTYLEDADNDTKIQVEESADEDIIHIDIAGSEVWQFDQHRLEPNFRGNVCVGYRAGLALESSGSTGTSNNLIGENAGYNMTSGSYNIASGTNALLSNTTGNNNIANGASALISNTTGSKNVAIGYQAGYYETGSNKLYIENSLSTSPLIYGEFDNDLLRINGELNINNEFSFPTTDGSANQVLETDGSGTLSWVTPSSSGSSTYLEDADADTKIQVEETADEDIIRFDIAGNEVWRFEEHRIESNFRNNLVFGINAGHDLESSTGSHNTLFGSNAGHNITTGSGNFLVGNSAGYFLDDGDLNILIGQMAGFKLEDGNSNLALGKDALEKNVSGGYNIAIGEGAGNSCTGSNNIFLGTSAGYSETGSNKLYIENSSSTSPLIYGEFDNDLLRINGELNINNEFSFPTTDGSANQVLETDGSGSLSWVTPSSSGSSTYIEDADADTKIQVEETADEDIIRFDLAGSEVWSFKQHRIESNFRDNILIGLDAGLGLENGSSIGYSNTVIGKSAGKSLTHGKNNSLFGEAAGFYLTTGYANSMFGNSSAASLTTGAGNVLFGFASGSSLTSQSNNVMLGVLSGNLVKGDGNVILGMAAARLANGVSGNADNNVIIGKEAGYDAKTLGDANIFLGYRAGYYGTGSNKLYIANSNTTSPLIYGEFDNDLLEINGDLRPGADNTYALGGSSNKWTAVYATNGTIQTSDVRFKKNIQELDYGLNTLMQLRSVSYQWKTDSIGDTKLGFIAQELENIVPEVVNIGSDSMQTRGVNYAELIPVLVKAIQEQQTIINDYRAKTETAEQRLDVQDAKLTEMQAMLQTLLHANNQMTVKK